ncbi:MAG: hypothetical protein AAF581_10505 [Planctomycetota bacterium]
MTADARPSIPTKVVPGGVCPSCETEFQGSSRCLQCGLDLTPVMRLAIEAHRLRGVARKAIRDNRLDEARAAIQESARLALAPATQKLARLVDILDAAAAAAHDVDDESQDEVSTEVAFRLLDYAAEQREAQEADVIAPEEIAEPIPEPAPELPAVRDVSVGGLWSRVKGLFGRRR